jgi:hypothetical protein
MESPTETSCSPVEGRNFYISEPRRASSPLESHKSRKRWVRPRRAHEPALIPVVRIIDATSISIDRARRSLHHVFHSPFGSSSACEEDAWALCRGECLLSHRNTGKAQPRTGHADWTAMLSCPRTRASPRQRHGQATCPTSNGRARDASCLLHAQPPAPGGAASNAGLVWLSTGPRQTQPLPETAASARALRHLIGRAPCLMPLVSTAVS